MAGALAALLAGTAQAADPAANYPDKPIRIIVPYPPGGSTDVLARALGAYMGAKLGQSVIVENKAGASGAIGANYVQQSPADGYTLFLGTSTALAVAPLLYKDLPYKVDKFAPIVMATILPSIVVVNPQFPVQKMADLVPYLKAHPNINYASSSVGTPAHLGMELFKQMTGTQLNHVPYKGGAPALNDLAGGQVSIMIGILPETMPLVKGGRLRVLAVTTDKRLPDYPDLPTVAESGVPGYDLLGWYGFLAPVGTPKAVVDKLNTVMNEGLKDPELNRRLTDMGFQVAGGSPAEFAKVIRDETAKWKKVIEDGHINAE
jgi:tripartite-type tricarboxylate transporter receptor subunit TctC